MDKQVIKLYLFAPAPMVKRQRSSQLIIQIERNKFLTFLFLSIKKFPLKHSLSFKHEIDLNKEYTFYLSLIINNVNNDCVDYFF